MFEQLTDSENNELYRRMARAGTRYYKLTGLLTATVHFGRYMDAWREVIGLQQDINDSYNPGAEPEPEPALTECGTPKSLALADGTINGHYHFQDGGCDLEPVRP